MQKQSPKQQKYNPDNGKDNTNNYMSFIDIINPLIFTPSGGSPIFQLVDLMHIRGGTYVHPCN